MSAAASRPSGRGVARAFARVLDGSADRLPPAWTVALLPLVGAGLLLLAGVGWVGIVLVLTAAAVAVVALVRAASWTELVEPERRCAGLPPAAVSSADREDLA